MAERTLKNSLPAIIGSLFSANITPRSKKDGETLFSAVFAADLHTDADPWRDRTDILRKALAGIRRFSGADALVIAGDITNCGDEKEYILFEKLKKHYLRDITVVPQIGNHDSWHHSDDPNFQLAGKLFRGLCRKCGFKTESNYYYAEVCGYPFIVTGTEALCHNTPEITGRQLAFIEDALNKAVRSEKPVFIISHQPPLYRNGVGKDEYEASMGKASEKTDALLLKYAAEAKAPLLFFSGHIHRYDSDSIEKAAENLWYLNLPSLEYGERGCKPGSAFSAEIKNRAIKITARNFISGEVMRTVEIPY